MPAYDFNSILSFSDFECLVRDLLQKHLNIHLECFTEGRDGGIDLRCSTYDKNAIIIQAKRYKDYKSLINELENEVAKVKKLNPQRYIIATSVGLTPNNKEEIKRLFCPYILRTEDILGKDDLNNLLGIHTEIEKGFPKLWLTSTTVLDRIVNATVVNQSTFEWNQIQEEIETYVVNDSLNKATQILKENGYVIISGIPGIGKTTLARFLVYSTLGNDNEYEFVYMSDLEDGLRLYNKEKKQIFLYDDFLGSNGFVPEAHNYDGRLINFINVVKKSNDKRFILTTREYVFKDAQRYYEKIKNNNFDLVKCILELGDYTEIIRARILYNHIAKENLPKEYIHKLLKCRAYRKIINHPNFNPRIIETFIHGGVWKQISPDIFIDEFIGFFNKPYSVWESAFDKLEDGAKLALCLLSTLPSVITISDWRRAYVCVCEDMKIPSMNEHEWLASLRKMEGCFLKFSQHNIVAVHNPSILDFIVDYLNNHLEILEAIIKGAIYSEQLHTSNSFKCPDVIRSKRIQDAIKESFIRLSLSPQSCSLGYTDYKNKYYGTFSIGGFLLEMRKSNPELFSQHPGLYEKNITLDTFKDETIRFSTKIEIANTINWLYLSGFTRSDVFDILESESKSIEDFVEYIPVLKEWDVVDLSQNSQFVQSLENQIELEMEQLSTISEVDQFEESLQNIIDEIEISDFSDALCELRSSVAQDEPEYERDDFGMSYSQEKDDEATIDSMFTSLLAH